MHFPDTKYMGSKQQLIPFILKATSSIQFESILDAFCGTSCVAYAFKQRGKRVYANDLLHFCYQTAKATVENNSTRLLAGDIAHLLKPNRSASAFIQETFSGLYFSDEDSFFLDNTIANSRELNSPLKRSLAIAALCRACMKKRPRGIFTFVGKKGWDGRRDLKLSMVDQFLSAIELLNSCVFANKRKNLATCGDALSLSPRGIDLVYIDTPYISPHSDCDYTRRYHFVEGLSRYWEGVQIQQHTLTKKIESLPTTFKSAATAEQAFADLFEHFRRSTLVVSYGSNSIPPRDRMVEILRQFKKKVRVFSAPHKYCFGNHKHKVGDNNNDVVEYLFIAE